MLLAQSFDKEWLPQVQAFTSYKHSFSRSIYDSQEDWQMDVHGNGFHEVVPGIDFWYGMSSIKAGLTQTLIVPLKKKIDLADEQVTLTPGIGHKTSLTGGYNYPGKWQILAGLEKETRRNIRLGNVELKDSDKIVHSVTSTMTYAVAMRQTLGVNYKRTAAFFSNKNTTRADSYTLSYLRAF